MATTSPPSPTAAAGIFAGAAPYYQRYRPRYPDALFAALVERCNLSGGARVVDLGCGPGFLAVPLAALGAQVIAVDPSPEMLAAGRDAAAEMGCGAVTWIESTAEDLAAQWSPGAAPVCCATRGRSFHWMQREDVLAFLDRIIVPGGEIAVVEERRPQDIAWRQAVRDYVEAWHGGTAPFRHLNTRKRSGQAHREILLASPFSRLEQLTFPVARHWSLDRIIGYVYSTSAGNPRHLGDGVDAFEAGLRDRLSALPGAPYFEEEAEIVVTLAMRPARTQR